MWLQNVSKQCQPSTALVNNHVCLHVCSILTVLYGQVDHAMKIEDEIDRLRAELDDVQGVPHTKPAAAKVAGGQKLAVAVGQILRWMCIVEQLQHYMWMSLITFTIQCCLGITNATVSNSCIHVWLPKCKYALTAAGMEYMNECRDRNRHASHLTCATAWALTGAASAIAQRLGLGGKQQQEVGVGEDDTAPAGAAGGRREIGVDAMEMTPQAGGYNTAAGVGPAGAATRRVSAAVKKGE